MWQCPACLALTKSRMLPAHLTYKLKCRNSECKRIWILGFGLAAFEGRQVDAPPDLIPLDGGVWRGGRIHKVFCDGCAKVIAEHAPPEGWIWRPSPGAQILMRRPAEVVVDAEETEEEGES